MGDLIMGLCKCGYEVRDIYLGVGMMGLCGVYQFAIVMNVRMCNKDTLNMNLPRYVINVK